MKTDSPGPARDRLSAKPIFRPPLQDVEHLLRHMLVLIPRMRRRIGDHGAMDVQPPRTLSCADEGLVMDAHDPAGVSPPPGRCNVGKARSSSGARLLVRHAPSCPKLPVEAARSQAVPGVAHRHRSTRRLHMGHDGACPSKNAAQTFHPPGFGPGWRETRCGVTLRPPVPAIRRPIIHTNYPGN